MEKINFKVNGTGPVMYIDSPENDNEILAAQIMRQCKEGLDSAMTEARRQHPVRFTLSGPGLVGEVDEYNELYKKLSEGYSYQREGSAEIFETPTHRMVADNKIYFYDIEITIK